MNVIRQKSLITHLPSIRICDLSALITTLSLYKLLFLEFVDVRVSTKNKYMAMMVNFLKYLTRFGFDF